MAASSAPSSTRHWLVLAVAVAGFAAGLLYAVLSATVLHGEVTASSLSQSVEGSIDVGSRIYGDDSYGCTASTRGGPGVWTCAVPDADSGIVDYRVTVDDGSCWEARLASSDPDQASGMPQRASGCVRRLQLGF